MMNAKKNDVKKMPVNNYRKVKRLKLQFDAICELIQIRINREYSRRGRNKEAMKRLEDHIIVMGIEFLANWHALRNS